MSGGLPPFFRKSLYARSVWPVTAQPSRPAPQTTDVVPLCSWLSSWWPRAAFTPVRATCGDINSGTWQMCGCAGVRVCGCAGVWVCGCAGVRVCGCQDVTDRDSAAGLKARGIHCCPSFFISFAPPLSPHCAHTHTHTHTHAYLTPYRLHTNYRRYQITPQ